VSAAITDAAQAAVPLNLSKEGSIMGLKKILAFTFISLLGLSLLASSALAQKKVLIVQSYHAEYDWTDGVSNAIIGILDRAGIQHRTFYMDTKRKSGLEWKEESGRAAEKEMLSYNPDVVIAVDDDPQEYLVKKYAGNEKFQFVFCGMNGELETYGYPAKNITGILERTYADQSVKLLSQIIPGVKKAAFIADDSSTASLVIGQIQQKAKIAPLPIALAPPEQPATFEEWKKTVRKYDGDASIGAFLIPLYHTVKKADGMSMTASDVMDWTVKNTRKPIVGLWPFGPKDGALCAVVVDPKEHGTVAGQMAVAITGGKKASDLPIVENKQGYVIINQKTAQDLGIQVPYEIFSAANQLIK
jgi:ABC-type uncharacterized transport system substrate-binding protein